ncbi:MAG: CHAT domain-containing protein, partial [Acidobacteria bacterium]|nr:CHAT domain-containing protein [Acidobacteriota bacterium]
MRWTAGLLAGALLLGTAGRETAAQQQATIPVGQAAQAELFKAFSALSTDEARQAFVGTNPTVLTPTFASGYSQWVRSVQLLPPARIVAWTSLEWLARQTGPERLIAVALASRGALYGGQGRYDTARVDLERALPLVSPGSEPALRLSVLTSLATALGRLGDSAPALAMFNDAAALATEINDRTGLARVLNNLGSYHFVRGDLRRAQDAYTRSLGLSVDDGGTGTQARARALGNIGLLYLEVSDTAQAIRYLEEALALSAKSNAQGGAGNLLANLGHAYRVGDPAKAKAYLDRAWSEAEQTGDGAVAASASHNLALLAFDEERWDEATRLLQQSADLHRMGGNSRGLSEALGEMADVAIMRDDLTAAEALLKQTRDVAVRAGSPPALIRAQVGLAEVAELRGQSAQALALYKEAEQILETLSQQTIGSERTQQNFLSYRLAPYLGAAAVHATEGRFMDALLAAEQARARVLLSVIDGGRPVAQMSERERTRERDLTEQLAAANMALADERRRESPDAGRLESLQDAVTRARLAREAFADALYAAKPAVGLARGYGALATPASIAALLPPRTGALLFVLEPSRVWRYAVTATGRDVHVQVAKLPLSTPELGRMAQRVAQQIGSRDVSFSQSSKELRAVLFGGLDTWLARVDQLIVAPDGVLWQVPFQALQDSTGRYLIEQMNVSYTPSLSALSSLEMRKTSRPRVPTRLVALGDPDTGAGVPRLPEAAREVRALGNLYGASQSLVVTGADATEDIIRAQVGRASVLHVATHGDLDNNAPMYSFLRLTPTAPS